ncbi:MAG: Ig-like domain-containing protein, partial [Patescibacteria group bacterium]
NFVPATNLAANKALVIDTNIVDSTAPTIDTYSPADNATGVSLTANLVFTFNEVVTVVSGKNITIKNASDDSTVETILVTGGLVSGSGTNAITVNPSTTLVESTSYYILIDSGAFIDSASNEYAGISSTTTWNFTTASANGIAPTLSTITTTTSDGIYGPGEEIIIIATYDEDVSSDSTLTVTLNNGARVTLDRVSGNVIKGTYTVGETGSEESITELTVDSIFFELVHDLAGNTQTGSDKPAGPNNLGDSSNIVIDSGAPAVDFFSPSDNGTDVDTDSNLVMTFDETVYLGTGNIIIRRASDNSLVETISVLSSHVSGNGTTIIIIDPASDLDASTSYYIEIPNTAFHDDFGNFYGGISDKISWNFKTGIIVESPTIVSSVAQIIQNSSRSPILVASNIPTPDIPTSDATPSPENNPVVSRNFVIPSTSATTNLIDASSGIGARFVSILQPIVNSAGYKLSLAFITALAAASLAIASKTFTSGIFSQASQRIWQAFLSFFGFNRKQHPWGRVLDAESGNAIPGAAIQVYDHQAMQLKDTIVSNDRGLFSLLVPPGSYEFNVQKTGWVVTPKAPFLHLVAGEQIYDGTPVEVTKTRVLPIVLAMRMTESVPVLRRLQWRKVFQIIDLFIVRLSWPLLIFGVVLNSFAVIVAPTKINIIIEGLYAILILWKILLYFLLKPALGHIRDADTSLPLDLAVVRIYDAASGRLVETRTTSHDGSFLLLPPLGVYTIMVVRA